MKAKATLWIASAVYASVHGIVWAAEEGPAAPTLSEDAWWWQWLALILMAAFCLLICFKNPKRSHDA